MSAYNIYLGGPESLGILTATIIASSGQDYLTGTMTMSIGTIVREGLTGTATGWHTLL